MANSPICELNAYLTGGKEKGSTHRKRVYSLQPFEEIVLQQVNQFVKKKIDGVSHDDMTELCVQVLQATRRFHAFTIDQKKRRGQGLGGGGRTETAHFDPVPPRAITTQHCRQERTGREPTSSAWN